MSFQINMISNYAGRAVCCFKTSFHLRQLCRRMMPHCFAVKLKKCFCEVTNFTLTLHQWGKMLFLWLATLQKKKKKKDLRLFLEVKDSWLGFLVIKLWVFHSSKVIGKELKLFKMILYHQKNPWLRDGMNVYFTHGFKRKTFHTMKRRQLIFGLFIQL